MLPPVSSRPRIKPHRTGRGSSRASVQGTGQQRALRRAGAIELSLPPVRGQRRNRPRLRRGAPASAWLACGVAALLLAGVPSARAGELDLHVHVPPVEVDVETSLVPNGLVGPQQGADPDPEPEPEPDPAPGVERQPKATPAPPPPQTRPRETAPGLPAAPVGGPSPEAPIQELPESRRSTEANHLPGRAQRVAPRRSSRPETTDSRSPGPRGVSESTARGGRAPSNAGPPTAAEPEPRRLAVTALAAVKRLSFPLSLALLVAAFLLVQAHLDRRDPKFTLAPLDSKHDLLSFE
jgi:hypothetical protein